MPNKMIRLDAINVAGSPKVRSEIRLDVAMEYAGLYKNKTKLPFPVLYKVDKELFLGDGFHRVEAMKMLGTQVGMFDVREGSLIECIRYALSANSVHGVRRSNADKRQCVITALHEFTKLSNHAIAELSAVGDDLVSEVRKELESKKLISEVDKRTSKDGRSMTAAPLKAKVKGTDEDESKGSVAAPAAVPPASAVSETRDATGYPITPKAMVFWKRRQEPAALLSVISQIKSELNDARKNKDLLYCEVNFNAVEADLERIYVGIKVAVPHAVCPACQGQLVETCKNCRGRGVVSKHKYDTTPPELKKIREAKK